MGRYCFGERETVIHLLSDTGASPNGDLFAQAFQFAQKQVRKLIEKHPGLKLRYAIPWATALANELIYITRDLPEEWADTGLWIPYRK